MADQVRMTHEHTDGDRPMRHSDDEQIDGLRLQEYVCECGFSAAVLTRLAEDHPLAAQRHDSVARLLS